jgi:hypothetical protein
MIEIKDILIIKEAVGDLLYDKSKGLLFLFIGNIVAFIYNRQYGKTMIRLLNLYHLLIIKSYYFESSLSC